MVGIGAGDAKAIVQVIPRIDLAKLAETDSKASKAKRPRPPQKSFDEAEVTLTPTPTPALALTLNLTLTLTPGLCRSPSTRPRSP